jgi:uncharacterized protein (DUF4415 family)
MPKPDPELVDDENPEWTDEMFARARPAQEVLGNAFMAKARRGRPKSASPKAEVKIRIDAKVVEHLRASGPGWQTRVNAELAKAIKAGRL